LSTKIEWTDEVWNPMTGCTKISSGCDNCYAHTVAHRRTRDIYLRQLPVRDTRAGRENPFAPRFWKDRLERLASEFVWTENIRMGTSIENTDVARRVDALRQIPVAVRFISAEPLLGRSMRST
jgi:protein gp37